MDRDDAISWITDDAAEMAALLREAAPDQPVPACPGWNAADLSRHIALGFGAWYCDNIAMPVGEWAPEGLMDRIATFSDDHHANVDIFESGAAQFVTLCCGTPTRSTR